MISRINSYERETIHVLFLVHELDICFGKGRASISRLAEMKHFWHELIAVALHSEAVMTPFNRTVGSLMGKKYWEKEKVTLKSEMGRLVE